MDDRHQAFAHALTREERLLIEIRDAIYEGSWEALRADLDARQQRQPFIIKLSTRIERDLERIDKLENYEQLHSINLKDFLPPLEPKS